jgi:3-oxoacyl-[acyl-carrier-protein] synthase II
MSMTVLGLACLGSFGAGVGDLSRGETLAAVQEDGRAAAADLAALKERVPARSLRQMDRFTRMALLCLLQAMDDAGLRPDGDPAGTGIILASGYGPATPTFSFLDSLLAHGEQLASPLSFSHSVHNIPAASLALQLDLTGPCLTFCQRDNPVPAGLLAARQWLEEGRVDRVFFGAVDEHTPLLAAVTRRILAKRAATPASRAGLRASLPISEGAAFFCLAPAGGDARRGVITEIAFRRGAMDDCLTEAAEDEVVFLSGAVPPATASRPPARYGGSVYGNIPIAQAFDLAIALTCRDRVPSGRAFCCGVGSQGETSGIHVRQADTPGGDP